MNQIKSVINSIIDLIYPVGSTISNESATFNPNTLYTGTTWERIKGKVIVGVDEDDTDFNTSEKTGGEKEHTLTIDEMPSHSHTLYAQTASGSNSVVPRVASSGMWDANKISSTGGGQAHNNMPPFYTAYMWRRTA